MLCCISFYKIIKIKIKNKNKIFIKFTLFNEVLILKIIFFSYKYFNLLI
jgi:hypothetical protein